MQKLLDFIAIIREAWNDYDDSRQIKTIEDISAKVSTNHVYRLKFEDEGTIIAKLSYFGRYDHFVEDHTIINALANNLHEPFDNFLARSLTKHGNLFVHRYSDSALNAWIVFYNPIKVSQKPARKQSHRQIEILGRELASFHKACYTVKNALPPNYKSINEDVSHLREIMGTEQGKFEYRGFVTEIHRQCDRLEENLEAIGIDDLAAIPVFVDWNIGNFSVNKDYQFFSRWDYDWFRMSTRVMDFYFFSRVCSSVGDKTIFSYLIDPLMEERFSLFLKSYHQVYPLMEKEILLIKEAYRFFILNYVIKDGRYFFNEIYATRLQQEAMNIYFPKLDTTFNPDLLLKSIS
jgi:Ser/Thr protein kinase RdoA (MazF antagonist)